MTNSVNRLVQVTEIFGTPGQVWGTVVVPASGKAKMKIVDDTLHTTTTTSYGLETKEIYTRIQNIDSVELVEGRLWWLLILGLSTLVIWLIGILFIVLFFTIKQNWIVVHTPCANIILFYKKTQNSKGFCDTLLAISRQLNGFALPRVQNGSPQAARQSPGTNARPAPSKS